MLCFCLKFSGENILHLQFSRQSPLQSGSLLRPSPATHKSDLCSPHKSPPHTVTGSDQVQLVSSTTESWYHKTEPKSVKHLPEETSGQHQPMLPKSKRQAFVPFPRSSRLSCQLWVQNLSPSPTYYTSSNDPHFLLPLPLQLLLPLLGMLCFGFFSY